jgi:hypothetical protein
MLYMRLLRSAGLATALALLWLVPVVQAQDYVWAPDFPVGATIPAIEAPDQNGVTRSFVDLVGENGLLMMFSRSFDW